MAYVDLKDGDKGGFVRLESAEGAKAVLEQASKLKNEDVQFKVTLLSGVFLCVCLFFCLFISMHSFMHCFFLIKTNQYMVIKAQYKKTVNFVKVVQRNFVKV